MFYVHGFVFYLNRERKFVAEKRATLPASAWYNIQALLTPPSPSQLGFDIRNIMATGSGL